MTSSDVMAILKLISSVVCLGAVIYVLYGVQKTLNFTRRFNKISEDSKRVGALAHELTLKYIKDTKVGFDEYGYYASKYNALVDLIHEYQSSLRWYNSDKFEKTYYEHVLTMLKIDHDSITSFREMRSTLNKPINTEYRNRQE